MSKSYDMAAFRERIGAIRVEDNATLLKQKSRDFYWYSPVLKRELDAVAADLMVSPTTEAEVKTVLASAHALGIPVTPRGGGTGNYGQAMPLNGGVLLNLSEMNKIKSISPGRVVSEPGALLIDIDAPPPKAARNCACSPRRARPRRSRGFVAGGSGGIGSITWGGLRDFGNVLRLRVLTMEAEPRALELTGADLHKAVHAYGTNGIITEVEMPLTARLRLDRRLVGFETFEAAAAYAMRLGEQDGLLKKLVTVVATPGAARLFSAPPPSDPARESVVMVMVARTPSTRCTPSPAVQSAELLFDASGLRPRRSRACRRTTNSRGITRPCAACASIRRSPICRRSILLPTARPRSSASTTASARR